VSLTAYNPEECESTFFGSIVTSAQSPDVEVESINLIPNADGTGKLIATLYNRGNTILKKLPVEVSFDDQLHQRLVIEEPILPNSKRNVVLANSPLNMEQLSFVCVFLKLDTDVSAAGNRMCREFQGNLVVFPVYPNPVAEDFTIEWIAPGAQSLQVSLHDQFGREVFSASTVSIAGLNTYLLAVSELRNGVYFLVLDRGSSKNVQRVVVVNTR
jgi:hypothetical protein